MSGVLVNLGYFLLRGSGCRQLFLKGVNLHCSFHIFIVRLPSEAQLLGVPTFPAERSSEGVAVDGCVVGRVASLLSSQEAGLPARSSRLGHLGFGWVRV